MGGEDDGRGAQVQVAGEPQAKGGEAVQVPVTGGGAAAEGTDAHRLSMRPRPTSATRRPRSGSEVAEAVRTAESVGDSHRDGRATARSRRRGLGCSRTAHPSSPERSACPTRGGVRQGQNDEAVARPSASTAFA